MRSRILGALAGAGLVLATAGTARAQAMRTWVSGVGDDENPCSRTAPCLTFASAVSKTAAPGIVNVIDPGDFGPVTITTSLTILGPPAGVQLTATGTAITVAAGAEDRVVLRNLALDGNGTGTGIAFASGRSLLVENVTITNFGQALDVAHTGGGGLFLSDVRATGNSVAFRARALAGNLLGSITDSTFDRNDVGVEALAGGRLSFIKSSISGNGTGIQGAAASDVNVEHVLLANNGTGIRVNGAGVVRASAVAAGGNTVDTVTENGGAILSFGGNRSQALATIVLASTAPSATVRAGTAATYPVVANVTGLLASAVAFTCTGLPAGAACTATSLPNGTGSGAVTVTVTTTGTKTAMGASSSSTLAFGGVFLLPVLLGLGRRRRWRAAPFRLALLRASGWGGAGGAHDGGTMATPTPSPGTPDASVPVPPVPDVPGVTPAGTHAFKVVATSGTTTGSLDLTLLVE